MLYGIKHGRNHSGKVEKWHWLRLATGEIFWTEFESVARAQLEAQIDCAASSESCREEYRLDYLPAQTSRFSIDVFEGEPI